MSGSIANQFLERWLLAEEKKSADFGKPRPSSITKYKNDVDTLISFFKKNGHEFLQPKDLTDRHVQEFQAWRLQQTRFGKEGGVPITPKASTGR